MRTIEQMVQQEVMCCMSSIISTLARGWDECADKDLNVLCEQAFELASPIPDYEEAARQAGWGLNDDGYFERSASDEPEIISDKGDWRDVCEYCNIEPYCREVFEHWAVSQWFADKLREADEKVDDDFGGLCIWARTTTGQGIASDGVVERIHAAMMVQA